MRHKKEQGLRMSRILSLIFTVQGTSHNLLYSANRGTSDRIGNKGNVHRYTDTG